MPSFYNGRRFFLTYPQCDALPHQLAAFLSNAGPIEYYLVSRERHADGSPHLHACVSFSCIQRHDKRWLDFNGKHPNKQDPRNWSACKVYVKKDGDFIEGPEEFLESENGKLMEPLKECETFQRKEEWMQHALQKKYPFPYALYFWERLHGNQDTLECDAVIDGTVCSNLAAFAFNPDIHRCLVLRGPSGIGKTVWAKRQIPKPALFVSHIDQLKGFIAGYHKGIIFDDVDFNHYPRTSQIHIVDFDNTRAIHCRHSIATIPAGVYKIFTCNASPLNVDDPAIRRRVQLYHYASLPGSGNE